MFAPIVKAVAVPETVKPPADDVNVPVLVDVAPLPTVMRPEQDTVGSVALPPEKFTDVAPVIVPELCVKVHVPVLANVEVSVQVPLQVIEPAEPAIDVPEKVVIVRAPPLFVSAPDSVKLDTDTVPEDDEFANVVKPVYAAVPAKVPAPETVIEDDPVSVPDELVKVPSVTEIDVHVLAGPIFKFVPETVTVMPPEHVTAVGIVTEIPPSAWRAEHVIPADVDNVPDVYLNVPQVKTAVEEIVAPFNVILAVVPSVLLLMFNVPPVKFQVPAAPVVLTLSVNSPPTKLRPFDIVIMLDDVAVTFPPLSVTN